MVTKINTDSVHGDRLTRILGFVEPVGGIGAYIETSGFQPWGRKFKLLTDDPILMKFMELSVLDIEHLLCHFAAEVTVRGNGRNTRNFGESLDTKAIEKYIDHVSTFMKKMHPFYPSHAEWRKT